MTIAISISVQDGVVLASDSAVEHRGQIYYSAEKTVQLIKGLPIDEFSQGCIDKTLKELTDEQAGVAHLI